eukprot:5936508-Pleurochrysis_carterae.AAC.3
MQAMRVIPSASPRRVTATSALLSATHMTPAGSGAKRLERAKRESSRSNACECECLSAYGTLSPTPIWTMSPGTSSLAGTVGSSSPFRTQQALHVCSCLSASSALSALASCQTPTIALITRISRITNGSTNACIPSSWWSSKKART